MVASQPRTTAPELSVTDLLMVASERSLTALKVMMIQLLQLWLCLQQPKYLSVASGEMHATWYTLSEMMMRISLM